VSACGLLVMAMRWLAAPPARVHARTSQRWPTSGQRAAANISEHEPTARALSVAACSRAGVLQRAPKNLHACGHRCDKPKPPFAHHCSVCGFCVVDMDHHCPFLANCVGRGNLRPFLLFLLWVVVAMGYAIVVMALSLHKHRHSVRQARAACTCATGCAPPAWRHGSPVASVCLLKLLRSAAA
jgi:DHHC palmitoyltransferase